MDTKALGIAAALGSAASWAVGSVLFTPLGQHLSPLAMTLCKGVLSLLLLAVALVLGANFTPIPGGALWLLALSGLLGIAIGDACFFEALQGLGPHTLAVLLSLGQVLTVLLAVVFLGERPEIRAWAGIGLVVAGVGAVVRARVAREARADTQAAADASVGGRALRGLLFGLLSVGAMSVSVVVIKEPLKQVSALEATFVRMLAGTLGMLLVGLLTGQIGRWVTPFHDRWLLLRFLAAVGVITFGGFWLSLVAIQFLPVAVANTLICTEPVFVLPLAALFLGEALTVAAIGGTLLAVAGMALVFIA